MNNISIVGNLTHDPELHFSANGKGRASFTVAVNEKRGDEEVAHFMRCTAFGTLAENVAESLRKGHRVVVVGRLNTWSSELTLEDGSEKRITNVGLTASSVGPDLLWARARVAKVDRVVDEAPEPVAAAAPKAKPVAQPVDEDEEEPAPVRIKPKAKEKVMATAGGPSEYEEEPF